jgi:hypothetical protein
VRRILAQPELQLVGLLSDTFTELTDTMVAGFDVIDFLRVVAASSEAARLLELFRPQDNQGPCLDCFRAGQPVAAPDLAGARAAGRGSRPPPGRPGSPPCTPCRCGCASRSSVR